MCGQITPYAPRSSTCLACHCAFSPPFGGMRAIGVTAGLSEPDCAISRRFSMYWRQSRKPLMSYGLCSISNTTPSYLALASALADSTSVGVNAVNACRPCSSARMMPLSRGRSAIVPSGGFALFERGVQPAIDLKRIALEDFALVGSAQLDLIDIALGVIVMTPRFRIDALDGAHHLRGEQDIVDRDDPGQQLDSGQVIDAGVEEHVIEKMLGQRRPLHVLGEAAVAAPMIRRRAAAVRDDEFQRRKILEQVGGNELHEGGRVAIDVMGAGAMEAGIA